MTPSDTSPVLSVSNLCTDFRTRRGTVRALDHVSFDVRPGGCLGIVGESGSGKSVTALSIMRLLPRGRGEIAEGTIRFDGQDLLSLPEARMREIRGRDIAMIFQEPMTSLNPVFTAGHQISEAGMLHQGLTRAQAWDRAVELLELVGIPNPKGRAEQYPHELSGGMRQRVMIAMALCCDPKVLIADEPTTALDVTVQAQILDLLQDLRERLGTAIIMITHDLGVIAEVADDVVVMYAGQIVETGSVERLFERPGHPYTHGLLQSIPRFGEDQERLHQIPGSVPSPLAWPTGCRFNPRCEMVRDICREAPPPMVAVGHGQQAQCWKHENFMRPPSAAEGKP